MLCTFCKNKGIPGPHNHTVRNWTLSDKPIICPQLLSTRCTFCNNIGHTQQYCSIKQSIERFNNINYNKRQLENIICSKNKFQKK